jgi:5'-nucleotidase
LRRLTFAIALTLALSPAVYAQDFQLKIIAFNDLHGFLQSPGKFSANAESPSVPVGGADYLAGYISQLKSQNPLNVVVSAGDLTGASPLIANLFHDEGTIEVANRLGLEINAVGNHEFDSGKQELLRKQHGGCSTRNEKGENTCQGKLVGTPVPFEGAHFKYLAANVVDAYTGKPILPAYEIKTYRGVKVAFIGLTLKEVPSMEIPATVADLRFTNEATAINTAVAELRKQGIKAIVVLIHQGGSQTTKPTADINACAGDLEGTPIRTIVGQLDDAVDLVISAHTHLAYICQIPNFAGRKIPVTSAAAFGRLLTDIDVTIDPKTRDIKSVAAHNTLVDRTNPAITPNPTIAKIVAGYDILTAPIVNRIVGTTSAEISKDLAPSYETPMGDLIADAQLEATRSPATGGAVVAFMNEGGIRAGLPSGQITYGDLFTAQPFGNSLITKTLTGAQIKILLEEQFKGCVINSPGETNPAPTSDRILEVSEGFTYTWSRSAAPCHKVDPASIKLNGITIDPAATYRVTANMIFADGGSEMPIMAHSTNRLVGINDIDAMTAYFSKHTPIAPTQPHRITVGP